MPTGKWWVIILIDFAIRSVLFPMLAGISKKLLIFERYAKEFAFMLEKKFKKISFESYAHPVW